MESPLHDRKTNHARWFESYQLPLTPVAAFICMVAGPLPAFAQQAPEADPYNAGREIIADIGKIVTPNGVQETFEMNSRRCSPGRECPRIGSRQPAADLHPWRTGSSRNADRWSFSALGGFLHGRAIYQRGAGRSYALNDPEALAPTLTLDRYRDDAIELIEALQKKYGKRKVFLLGHSWGSWLVSPWPPSGRTCSTPMSAWVRPSTCGRQSGPAWHGRRTGEEARRPGSTERAGRDPALSGLGTVYDREGRRVEGLCDPFWLACCVPAGRPLLPPSAAAFAGI